MVCDGKHSRLVGRGGRPRHKEGSVASPVVVMGVSGSGKSTVGAALAQRLRVPFAERFVSINPGHIALTPMPRLPNSPRR